MVEASLVGKPFKSFYVERHNNEGEVAVMSWGENSPGVDMDDYGDSEGLLVKLDGEEVFNSLKEIVFPEEEDCGIE